MTKLIKKRLKLAERNRVLYELVTRSEKPWRANYFHENEEHKIKRNFIEKLKYKIKKKTLSLDKALCIV